MQLTIILTAIKTTRVSKVCRIRAFAHVERRNSPPFSFQFCAIFSCRVKVTGAQWGGPGSVEKGFQNFKGQNLRGSGRCVFLYSSAHSPNGHRQAYRQLWDPEDTLLITINMKTRVMTLKNAFKKDREPSTIEDMAHSFF